MPPLPDQDRIDEREGVARIIDPIAWDQWDRWKGALPDGSWSVPLAAIKDARDAVNASLSKADAILALLRTTHD